MSLGLAPFAGYMTVGPPPVAPTYFAQASNPADTVGLTGSAVAVTPPASMVVGDLVLVACMTKTISLTWSITTTGGQSWTSSAVAFGASAKSCAFFWCRFNGTWAANPVFTCATAAGASTAVMTVFRPDVSTRVWAVDVGFVQGGFAAPAGPPYVVSISGLTTVNPRTVTFAVWYCGLANTYTNIAGAGWVSAGAAQIRNGAAASSMSHAYALNGAGGVVVPSVSKEESASTQNQIAIIGLYAS
jgi:hypothetical protein